ncbi:MAG: hypothetical protein QXL94_07590 [Candidatus Parvarchaeum sp.]
MKKTKTKITMSIAKKLYETNLELLKCVKKKYFKTQLEILTNKNLNLDLLEEKDYESIVHISQAECLDCIERYIKNDNEIPETIVDYCINAICRCESCYEKLEFRLCEYEPMQFIKKHCENCR